MESNPLLDSKHETPENYSNELLNFFLFVFFIFIQRVQKM